MKLAVKRTPLSPAKVAITFVTGLGVHFEPQLSTLKWLCHFSNDTSQA